MRKSGSMYFFHVVFLLTAYKEKMKELSLVSLICSCLYPEARNTLMAEFEGKILSLYEKKSIYNNVLYFEELTSPELHYKSIYWPLAVTSS